MKSADLLKIAKQRMDDAASADLHNRDRAEDDFKFLIGEQWPTEVKTERDAAGKPCLIINGLPQFVRQVTGQIRSMNPAIKVMAADGEASEDVAEIQEGLIRQIEYKCDAPSIYEETAATAAACGVGYWRVRADYCDGLTFDQELLIERIYNPFSVYFDPLSKDPTRKDARYCFVIEEMETDDFRAQYPDADMEDFTSDNRGIFNWGGVDTVTVAEYFWIEQTEKQIALLPSGQVIEGPFPKGVDLPRKRTVKVPKVMWAKITACDVLEGPTEIPCPYIPVVAVTGEEWHVGEEMYRSSVIRFAKDPQMLYNYARSAQAEVIALQPKAPYIVSARQVEGLEAMWSEANNANRPYLVYNPDENAPAPQRVPPPIPSQALMTEIQLAAEDMKRTTGIYDASLGAQSNEKSGVAIRERKMEAQVNTSIYADNMVKAITQTGKILCAMIPRVYDTQRVIRILGEQDQEKMVVINAMMMTENGPMPVNDMTVGKYDVRIGVGPSYQTKRQEAAEGMTAFMQTIPQAAPLVADLVAGAQDWPDADKIAERLRKQLPPGIVEDDQEQPDPAQMQQMQMQQQQQQMQMQQQMEAEQIAKAEAVAKAKQAEANARKAEAEAVKAEIEVQAMLAPMNVGMMPRAPMGADIPQGY